MRAFCLLCCLYSPRCFLQTITPDAMSFVISQSVRALYPIAFALCWMVLSGCTTASPNLQPPPSVEPTYSAEQIAQLVENTRGNHHKQWLKTYALRKQMDRQGRLAQCPHHRMVKNRGHLAWLDAWCAYRHQRADALLRSASRAVRYFGEVGDLRRQSELYSMMALAYAQKDNALMAEVYGQKTRQLMLNAQLTLTGDVSDPYAGDLPYLLGQLARRGFVVKTTKKQSDWTSLFLSIAISEYKSTQRVHAQSHALRARAQHALIQGDIQAANRDLQAVLRLAQHTNNPNGVFEAAITVADLAIAQQQEGFAQQLEDWLMHQQGPTFLPIPQRLSDFPDQKDDLFRLMRTSQGRRSLLEYVRRIRRTPALALNPPRHMMLLLLSLKQSRWFSGSGWALAYEMGQLLHERGMTAHARRYFRWAIAAAEALRQQLPDPRLRQTFFANKRELYLDLIHSYVGIQTASLTQRDYRQALKLGSALKARGLIDLMHQRTSTGTKLVAVGQLRESHKAPAAASIMLKQLLAWQRHTPKTTQTTPQIKALPQLAPKTMMVEFVVGKRAGYVWVIHQNKVHMRRIAGRRALKPLLTAFRKTLVMKRFTKAQAIAHRKQAERLFVALFGPVQDLISKAEHVIIAPDDLLHDLPFEVLAIPKKSEMHLQPHYIVRDVSVSYVPSTMVLSELIKRPTPQRAQRALLLGNPKLKKDVQQLLSISPSTKHKALPSFSRLFPPMPGSQKEVQSIAHTLGRTMRLKTLLGASATELALRKARLHQYDVIHLSTHGLSDATAWQKHHPSLRVTQPTLLLGSKGKHDGLMRLDEVVTLKTRARLVVLSGCTTGRGWRSLGDGAYGLAGAFLSAGAQSVVASMWDVADLATGRLMQLFYTNLSKKQDAARALRNAQLHMLRYKTPAYANYLPPYYWASFRIIGLSWQAKL